MIILLVINSSPWFSFSKQIVENIRPIKTLQFSSVIDRLLITYSVNKLHIWIMKEANSMRDPNPMKQLLCQMDYSKISLGNLFIVSLLFAGVLYICIWSPSRSNPLLPYQKPQRICPHTRLVSEQINFHLWSSSSSSFFLIFWLLQLLYIWVYDRSLIN